MVSVKQPCALLPVEQARDPSGQLKPLPAIDQATLEREFFRRIHLHWTARSQNRLLNLIS